MTFMMQLRTAADIADVEARLAARVPGVDIIEACVGVHSFKRMGWMLDPEGRPTGEVVTGALGGKDAGSNDSPAVSRNGERQGNRVAEAARRGAGS